MNFSNLIRFQRAYNCDDTLEEYICQICDDTTEHARIRGGAFVHSSVYEAIAADPDNPTVWATPITDGDVVILPAIRGSFDGGTPKIVDGYGDSKNRTSGYEFSASIEDPVYKQNWAFYKSLVGKTNWHFAYRTETQTHLTSVPVNVAPKNPITNSLEDEIVWNSEITWSESFTPAPFDTPADVFTCAG